MIIYIPSGVRCEWVTASSFSMWPAHFLADSLQALGDLVAVAVAVADAMDPPK